MPESPSPNRGYFRFNGGESPKEGDLNAGLVDKLDSDVQNVTDTASQNQSDLATLKARVDQHVDVNGDLTQTPPEFAAFGGAPTFLNTTQFSVVGNFTNEFSVNRAVRATITGSTPISRIQTSTYNAGQDKTFVTLFDAILDNTLAAVSVGFIQQGLPKITEADLTFQVGGANPATQAVGDTAVEGTGSDPARVDHKHAIPKGNPVALAFGDTVDAGSSGLFSDASHRHAVEEQSLEVLNRQTSGFPKADSTGEEDLWSYTMPASTAQNGDYLRLMLCGQIKGNTGGADATLTLRLKIGGNTFLTLTVQTDQGPIEIGDSGSFRLDAFLFALSNIVTLGCFSYSGPYADSTAGVVINGAIVANRTTTFVINLANSLEFKVTGQWSSINGTPEITAFATNFKIER